jgi:RNA polymerase sigma-70 factor (TIGR02943 family)
MSLQPGEIGGGLVKAADERGSSAIAATDPSRWVDEHGDVLYRYALERVRKPDIAQDLVQETFLAAVRTIDRFRGGSTVRSWLCGILKHKICDYYRKRGRETSFTDLEFLNDECAEKFVPEGYWVHMNGPKEWKPEADEVMHRHEFWKTMRDCLGKLPERVATVFMMREMDEVESKEICSILSISDSNLWVMLHRARMALRECLAMNWFENPVAGGADPGSGRHGRGAFRPGSTPPATTSMPA